MSRYLPQELNYSCSANAVANCLIHLGEKDITEKKVRRIMGIGSEGGCEEDIAEAVEHFEYQYKEAETKSQNVFKRKIIKALKSLNVAILLVDNESHWIAVLDYKNRKIKTVDIRYKEQAEKSIVQWITMKELIKRAMNWSIKKKLNYFYFMEIF